MPIDPSIPLQVREPAPPTNVLAGLAQVAQIKSATLQNALVTQEIQQRTVQAQQAQYAQGVTMATNKALQSSIDPTTGQVDFGKARKTLNDAGFPQAGLALDDLAAKHSETLNKMQSDSLALSATKAKTAANIMGDAADQHAWSTGKGLIAATPELGPQVAAQIPDVYSDQAKQQVMNRGLGISQAIENHLKQTDATKNISQANQADAATANDKAKLPQIQAESAQATRAQAAAQLVAAGPNGYAAALAKLPPEQQGGFPAKYDRIAIARAAETPVQAIADQQKQTEIGQGQQRINIEQSKLAVERFNAGLGADNKPLADSDKTLLKPVVQNTTDGRTFIDEGTAFKNLPKGQALQLRQAAVNAGVPMVSSADAGKIQKLDTVKQNIQDVFDTYAKNAASNAATRPGSYIENKFGTVFQTNPELKAAEGNKLGQLETLRDAMGRVNTVEINKAEALMPQLGDTRAVVEDKRKQFNKFLDEHQNALTHNVQVKGSASSTATPQSSGPPANLTQAEQRDWYVNHHSANQ